MAANWLWELKNTTTLQNIITFLIAENTILNNKKTTYKPTRKNPSNLFVESKSTRDSREVSKNSVSFEITSRHTHPNSLSKTRTAYAGDRKHHMHAMHGSTCRLTGPWRSKKLTEWSWGDQLLTPQFFYCSSALNAGSWILPRTAFVWNCVGVYEVTF